jgi:hypothetical protein
MEHESGIKGIMCLAWFDFNHWRMNIHTSSYSLAPLQTCSDSRQTAEKVQSKCSSSITYLVMQLLFLEREREEHQWRYNKKERYITDSGKWESYCNENEESDDCESDIDLSETLRPSKANTDRWWRLTLAMKHWKGNRRINDHLRKELLIKYLLPPLLSIYRYHGMRECNDISFAVGQFWQVMYTIWALQSRSQEIVTSTKTSPNCDI